MDKIIWERRKNWGQIKYHAETERGEVVISKTSDDSLSKEKRPYVWSVSFLRAGDSIRQHPRTRDLLKDAKAEGERLLREGLGWNEKQQG